MNPFQPIYDQCNGGTSEGKYQALADGPAMVDIEPVGLCNFRCVMCPTGLQALERPGGFMALTTLRAILDKTASYRSAIRFIGWGEPLMHPSIIDMVEECHLAGRLTHINTNASKLTSALARQLVDAGLSSIKFSFQGTDRETYLAMRRTDFFDGMLEAIGSMKATRGDNLSPYIAASTSTTDETPEQIEAFRAKLEPLVDSLSIGKTIFEFIDMAAVPLKQRRRLEAAAKLSTVEKRHPSPCPEVFDKLTIHWDGSVRVCCNDYSGKTYLGNVATDDFAGIWRHPQMEEYRARLSRKDYGGPLCSVCFDYMALTEREAAV